MKRKLLLTCMILLALSTVLGSLLFVGAEEPTPTMSIDYCNLSFRNTVYIKYAVKLENTATATVLIWKTAPEGDFVYGTHETELTDSGTQSIYGDTYYVYNYGGLSASQMTDEIYARAYVNVDGKEYYSPVQKYSILQYAYDQMGKFNDEPNPTTKLVSLMGAMLEYGAAAQTYTGHALDRLANMDFYRVSLVGGTLTDGFTTGLYPAGADVTLVAPETDAEGGCFSHWENSAGQEVGVEAVCTVQMPAAHETFCAVYDELWLFTELSDGTYSVKVNPDAEIPTVIEIPATYNGKAVTVIENEAFKNCTGLTSVTIPDSVTSIGSHAFSGCTGLTSITLPNNITSIPTSMLENCRGLTSVTIPDSVTSIDIYAFSNCTGLTSVTIPDSVTSIGSYAFNWCTGLTGVTIPDSVTSIGTYAFYNCTGLTSITIPKSVTSIGSAAFSSCADLASMTVEAGNTNYYSVDNCIIEKATGTLIVGCKNSVIPTDGSVTSIGGLAFNGCTGLTSITIPDGVTSIGGLAFNCCIGLTSITIPDGVTSIGEGAFYYCTGLKSVTIGNGVTSIENFAFAGCTGLTTVCYEGTSAQWAAVTKGADWDTDTGDYTLICYSHGLDYTLSRYETYYIVTGIGECTDTEIRIPPEYNGLPVKEIGANAFKDCTTITSITIPDSVTSIGDYVFYKCTGLTSVTIGNSVTSIGEGAFQSCCDLTSITIPDSVTSIGSNVFAYCTGLTSVTIPDSVTSIGAYAFYDCTGLTSVTIGNGVTIIGNDAFYNCTGLTSITIPDSVTSIGTYGTFRNCTGLTSVTIPDSVTRIGSSAFEGCTGLTTIYYKGTSAQWAAVTKGTAWDTNTGDYTLVCLGDFSQGLEYTLSDDETYYIVTGIGECTDTELKIPSEYNGLPVKAIGVEAFKDCTTITAVTIPDSVTSIGSSAFSGCADLASMTVEAGNTNYYSVDNCIIEKATGTLIVGCKNSVIPTDGSVTSIGSYAFEGCTRLTNITIPSGVTSIGDYAFGGCTGLTTVCYEGTSAQWAAVTKGADWDTDTGDYTLVCLEDFSQGLEYTLSDDETYYTVTGMGTCTDTELKIPPEYNGLPVKAIGEDAFKDCTTITSITIPDSVTSIADYALSRCANLTEIKVAEGNTAFCVVDNVLYTKDMKQLILYVGAKPNTTFTVPNTVTTIAHCSFDTTAVNLTEVVLPEGVTTVGYRAFFGLNLERIILPSTISEIPARMLESCASLITITYNGSMEQWNALIKGDRWNLNAGNYQLVCIGESNSSDYNLLSELLGKAPSATHTVGDGSLLLRYASCTETNYNSVCEWYEANGYTEYCEDNTKYTLSKTYVKDSAYATVFYKIEDSQLHVTFSNEGGDLLPEQITEYEDLYDVTLTQPYTTKKGTCEIFRLADGTFLILDSSNFGSQHEIFDMLCELNGGSENIHIRAWLLSHTHGDHYGGFVDFASTYASRVTLDTVLYAPVNRAVIDIIASYGTSWDTINYYFNDTLPATVATYFPNTDLCSVHAGQKFRFAGADLHILYTPEHLYIDSIPVNMNHGSIVAMISGEDGKMLFTGDSENSSSGWLMPTYQDELKCDILQYPHHGNVDSHVLSLVAYADPSVVLIPVTIAYFENTISSGRQALVNQVINMESVEASYFMGNGSVTLLLSGKKQ